MTTTMTTSYLIRIEYSSNPGEHPVNLYVRQGINTVAEFHGKKLPPLLSLASIAIREAEGGKQP